MAEVNSIKRVGGTVKNRVVHITNMNKLFERTQDPKILNEIYFDDPTVDIIDVLFQKSDGIMDFVPQCECGCYKSTVFEGKVCPFCATKVSSAFTKNFQPTSWIQTEPWMPHILHPRLYILLEKLASRHIVNRKSSKAACKKEKVSVISLILDPDVELPEDIAVGVHGQGMRYFAENYDDIISFLLLEHPKISKSIEAAALWQIYLREKAANNVLVDKIPILNSVFHPLHAKGKSKTLDKTADIIMPVLIDFTHTAFASKRLVTDVKTLDRELLAIYQQYIKYLKTVMEVKLSDKQALIRRHIVAGRAHWTGRGVIAPIIGKHQADEVYLPWNIAMMVYMCELYNFLVNRFEYTPTNAWIHIYVHINLYSEDIDKCFKMLIAECRFTMFERAYFGLPIIMNRNPTLIRPSMRECRVTVVKTDVNDKTINLGAEIYKGFNANIKLAA